MEGSIFLLRQIGMTGAAKLKVYALTMFKRRLAIINYDAKNTLIHIAHLKSKTLQCE
jgi:hypothetical protein